MGMCDCQKGLPKKHQLHWFNGPSRTWSWGIQPAKATNQKGLLWPRSPPSKNPARTSQKLWPRSGLRAKFEGHYCQGPEPGVVGGGEVGGGFQGTAWEADTPRLATGACRESEAKRQHYRLDSGIGSSARAAVLANWVPFPLRIRGLF